MQTGAKDILTKFFLLLGMEVGLPLFQNVDPSQKNFPIRQKCAPSTIKLVGGFGKEGCHGFMASFEGGIS